MSVKGFQIGNEFSDSNNRTQVFQTVQKTHLGRGLSNVIQHGAALIETIQSTEISNVLSYVTLPAHNAIVGNIIQNKTTGFEFNVISIDGDKIYLEVKKGLSIIGSVGDYFAVKQFVMSQLNEDGAMEVTSEQAPSKFNLDSIATEVSEDTVDPSNNAPFPTKLFITKDGVQYPVNKDTVDPNETIAVPVEIVGSNGTTINLTAGDINVQTSHSGANYDSMRIGDGTNLMGVNASFEGLVHDADVLAAFTAGQLARTGSLGVTLSTEDITLITDLYNKYSAGQTARATSLGVTLSTEDQAILDALVALYTAGQKTRAGALGVTLSTEDIALITSIFDKYSAGQTARATSLGVTLSTEDQATQDAIKAAVAAKGSLTNVAGFLVDASSTAITVAGLSLGLVSATYKVLIQNQADKLSVLINSNHVAYVLAGAEITIDCGGLAGDLVLKSETGSNITGGDVAIDLLG